MNLRIPGIVFLAIIASLKMWAQPESFSLKEAQEYAIENNYNVRNANAQVEVSEYEVKENVARGLPQLDGTLDYTYYIQLPTTIIPGNNEFNPGPDLRAQFGKEHNLFLNLNLSQLIFDTRYFIGLRYAKTLRQKSEEELIKTEIDVKALVAETYFGILVNEESLVILDSLKNVLEQTRYETEELYKAGFAEETDYDQLTLTITDIDNSINELKRQRNLGYDLLRFQLALPLGHPIELTEDLEDILTQIEIDAVMDQQFDINKNIDYRIINSQEQMSLLNVKNERSSFYPSINGFVTLQTSAQRDQFTMFRNGYPWFPTSSAGASLYVPIFSSGQRKARLEKAKLQLEQVTTSKKQLEQNLNLLVVQARAAFRTAVENFYREEDNVELALKIYDKALIKYSEGVTSSVELTQQHRQYFDAQSKYFQTVLELLNAKIELDKTLGNYNF
jgi:outer membrane protein TolC